MATDSLLTTIFFLETKSLPSKPTKRYESEPDLPKAENAPSKHQPAQPPLPFYREGAQPATKGQVNNVLPLRRSLLSTEIVARSAQGNQKECFRLTKGQFKQRFNGHQTFGHEEKDNATELSKYIWSLKRVNIAFEIKWSICQRGPAYTSASKSCALCLAELWIVKGCKSSLLNRHSELVSTCRHRKKHLLVMHKGALT